MKVAHITDIVISHGLKLGRHSCAEWSGVLFFALLLLESLFIIGNFMG